jgi:hypothetical protein
MLKSKLLDAIQKEIYRHDFRHTRRRAAFEFARRERSCRGRISCVQEAV